MTSAVEPVVAYQNNMALQELIDTAVGAGVVTPAQMANIKNLCKKSEVNVRLAHKCLMSALQEEHSQIRLACVEIIDQLFCRSFLFRQLTVDTFRQLVSLCIGLDDMQEPLPAPKKYAKLLRERSLRFVQESNSKWGSEHKQIHLAYTHLRRSRRSEFNSIIERAHQEANETAARAERRRAKQARQHEAVHTEMSEWIPDIESVVKQLNECLPLVVPKFGISDSLAVARTNTNESETSPAVDLSTISSLVEASEDVAGLVMPTHEVIISVSANNVVEVQETSENDVVIETIRENYKRLLRSQRPWLNRTIAKMQENETDGALETLEALVKLKSDVVTVMGRCDDLRIIGPESPIKMSKPEKASFDNEGDDSSSSDEEDDLEEVGSTKEGYEPSVLEIENEASSADSASHPSIVSSGNLSRTGDLSDIQQLRDMGLLPDPNQCSTTPKSKQRKRRGRPDTLVDPKREKNNSKARLLRLLKRHKRK